MNPAQAVAWLSRVLRRLPRPLLEVLDAWSRRVALRRATRRRLRLANRAARSVAAAEQGPG